MPTKSDGSSIILETPMGIEADDYSDRFDAIQELIDKAPCVVLVRHISPDSDAIGSVSAFAAALRTRYGENKKIIVSSEGSSVDPGQNGLVIYLDLGDADRVAGSLSGTYRTARIDHHPSSLQVDADASDDKAGSTCELLTLFLRTEGYGISKGMAASLLKGMAADNGRFEYNMSKSALVAAGILQDSGVDSKKLFGRMDSQSPSDAKARAFILNNYKRTKNGVAYIFVDDEVARKNGIPLESAASMAYELVKIRGCRIGALLIGRHGKINGRLRSQSIDITPVASKYGGGGHANACGVSVPDARTAIAMIRDLDALAANVKGQSLKESENIDEGVDAGFGILDAAVESLMHESIDADASEDIHMENNEITAISLIEGKLPDDPAKREYGVPEEKKFPLCDKAHVLSAIRFFNYVKPAHEKELASAIVSKMKAYDISFDSVGEDNRLRKYLPKSALKESENLEEILDPLIAVLAVSGALTAASLIGSSIAMLVKNMKDRANFRSSKIWASISDRDLKKNPELRNMSVKDIGEFVKKNGSDADKAKYLKAMGEIKNLFGKHPLFYGMLKNRSTGYSDSKNDFVPGSKVKDMSYYGISKDDYESLISKVSTIVSAYSSAKSSKSGRKASMAFAAESLQYALDSAAPVSLEEAIGLSEARADRLTDDQMDDKAARKAAIGTAAGSAAVGTGAYAANAIAHSPEAVAAGKAVLDSTKALADTKFGNTALWGSLGGDIGNALVAGGNAMGTTAALSTLPWLGAGAALVGAPLAAYHLAKLIRKRRRMRQLRRAGQLAGQRESVEWSDEANAETGARLQFLDEDGMKALLSEGSLGDDEIGLLEDTIELIGIIKEEGLSR